MKDPAGGVCVEEAEAEEEEEGGERKTGVPAAVASAAAVWAEGEPRAAPGPALPRGRDSGAWLPPSWRKTTPVLIPALEESYIQRPLAVSGSPCTRDIASRNHSQR
ncbi:uncharacterized protein LOC123635560 isoform X2 [Lemur catta]|uniref:uncharacterized protein LOC123635560 isoform X2 n=1 Tax=Lemur catta TaxID=9447 RepID=UPI001E26D1B5|nr:uncharacterized protein LOC123635560 isoform X2 [Lemur catta]